MAERESTALDEAAVVEATLPDSGSLPSGWNATQDKSVDHAAQRFGTRALPVPAPVPGLGGRGMYPAPDC
ncbi:hypothetical protein IAG44_42065 [Streptomyces roseirectus]|uniref:Uncharacterized protein n=1 Tax=Streptomyces roseirectus TaxID=2768066 RepID=A0A7H0IRD2_9ACTN|nr:hypothetical protein [Streptomyces roseirectus]QNP75348.1 hypothetical protein IAG44_42065 [Streptomyces roseirectus]